MILPSVRTFEDAPATGSILTYAEWNAALYDTVNLILNPPMVQLQHTAVQSIPPGAWTALQFQTEIIDTEGMHSTTVNNSRVTPKTPGWYMGFFGMSFAGTSTSGKRQGVPRKNGNMSNTVTYGRHDVQPTQSGAVFRGYRFFMPFNGTTDYVEVAVWQNSGGALNTNVISAQDYPELTLRWWKTL